MNDRCTALLVELRLSGVSQYWFDHIKRVAEAEYMVGGEDRAVWYLKRCLFYKEETPDLWNKP